MDGFAVALLILAALSFGVGMTVWTFSKSRQLLNQWASENGCKIVQAEFCWLRRGPFLWTSSKGQVVYHIVVLTADGHKQRGWARCGSFFLGLLQDRVQVKWEP